MIFLKLGGSLITNKHHPETPRLDLLRRLAAEIQSACESSPNERLLVGHGSGSFGHTAANLHGTHQGATTEQDWRGFAAVWHSANRLNRLVIDALVEAGAPAVAFPPSASALCDGGRLVEMETRPIVEALEAGLLPVVQGDVAFDRTQGSAIVSTEQVFAYLAEALDPDRLLLAGIETGVYADPETRGNVYATFAEGDLAGAGLRPSAATDVTGGMAAKVRAALELSRRHPQLEIRIFSGEEPGALLRALKGEPLGTLVRAERAGARGAAGREVQ